MPKDIEVKEIEDSTPLEEIPTDDVVVEEEEDGEPSAPAIPPIDKLIPPMNMPPVPERQEDNNLISDDALLGIYTEILETIKEDRKQVGDYLDNFADMIMNEGDSHTSSKEALVNLAKIKTDMTDKMIKVADLMTRVKMKGKDTYAYSGAHFNAMQSNTINIESTPTSKRELLKAINDAKKKKKEGQ